MESRATRLSKEAIIFSELHEINFKPASTPRRGGVLAIFFWTFRRPRSRKRAGAVRPSASFRAPALFLELGRRKVQKKIAKTPPRLGIKRRAWEARGRSRRGHGAGPWGYRGMPLWAFGRPQGHPGPRGRSGPLGRASRALRARRKKRPAPRFFFFAKSWRKK